MSATASRSSAAAPLVAGMMTPGQRVRVAPAASDGQARRALLLSIEPDSGNFEIEYADDDTEAVVPAARCSALLPFEDAASTAAPTEGAVATADLYKSRGNELFKLRDATAALEQYIHALRALQRDAPLSPGARCLVKPAEGNGPARSAMVLTADESSVDVEYEPDAAALGGAGSGGGGGKGTSERLAALLRQAEAIQDGGGGGSGGGAGAGPSPPDPEVPAGSSATSGISSWLSSWAFGAGASSGAAAGAPEDEDEEAEEEDGVARERVVLVVHPGAGALQAALLLNSAKCSMQLRDWAAAIARGGRAERVASHDPGEKALTQRRTALVVCARAAMGMQRFGLATTYAARLLGAPVPADAAAEAAAAKEVRGLLRDVQRRVAEVKRSNKRLAKELSAWVQCAMAASGQDPVAQAAALELT